MNCESCPASWGGDGHMTDCGIEYDDFGCLIYGNDVCSCHLSEAEITKRMKQYEDYKAGKIKRPVWLANRFINDMDHAIVTFPYFPPKRSKARPIETDEVDDFDVGWVRCISRTEQHYELMSAYRKGYEDAKARRPCNEEYWKVREEEEDLFE